MKDQSLLVRYPIGMFEYGKEYSNLDTLRHIREIADLPKKLKKIVKKLREGALDKAYRQHGWTVRQVVHHLADSHINAYVRMKLAVTENAPIVKPYEEQLWAETEDGKHGSSGMSLKLLSALHKRWVFFLSHLSDEDLDKVYYNPSSKRTIQLREAIALYAWHGKHHLAHVKLVADGNKKYEAGDTDVVEVKAKRMPKSGNAGTVTGKVVKEASGETEAPKRRGRPPLTKPAAKPVRQKKGTKVVIDSVQDTVSTTAEEVVVEKTAVAATAGKTAKTRTAKSARVEEVSSDKPRRGRPAVKKSASEAVVVPPSNVEEVSSDKPRRGRPAVKKSASEAVVVPSSNVEEASSDKPRRGRPAVKKSASEAVVVPPSNVEEVSSDKPRRGRPAVKKSASEAVVVPSSNVEEASSDKPRRGRPAVKKSVSEAVVVPPSNVEEVSSDKPRLGRPAVKKSASEAVVVPPSNIEEVSSDKPRRGRPAVKKSVSEAVVVPPSNVEEASSDKPRRGRPAVKKAATPEKPKRSRRTPEEIAAEKEKKG